MAVNNNPTFSISLNGVNSSYEMSKSKISEFSNVIFIDCAIEELYRRILKMPPRPMFSAMPIIDKLTILEKERKEKYLEITRYKIDGNGSIEETVKSIIELIKSFT